MLHSVTMDKQYIIRIKWNTFVRIKRVFPSIRDESVADYFSRLAKFLEEHKDDFI